MELEWVKERYGDSIDFGPCIVGRNLNLLTLRGFGALDALAAISAPDVYDMKLNPSGTQRDLKEKHAQDCFAYAMDSLQELPADSPRVFPEILLNARDMNVVELYNPDEPEELYDLTSFSDNVELDPPIVGLRVALTDIEFPKRHVSPQISRVDGNHRLHETDELLERAATEEDEDRDMPDEFPIVGFSMLMALETTQEASLFRDINGEHEGMETAHLDSIVVRITNPEELKSDIHRRPLWLAHELTKPGRAFEGKVFFGGSKAGVKEQGVMPPLKINSLKTTIAQQLRSAPTTVAAFGDKPEVILHLIDRYWKAVATTFPDAWANKRDYILLQAIGLGAFAQFGGSLIDTAVKDKEVEEKHFAHYLEVARDQVPLDRDKWAGIAGAGGQKVVAEALLKAAESDKAKLKAIEEELLDAPSISEKLEAAAPQPASE